VLKRWAKGRTKEGEQRACALGEKGPSDSKKGKSEEQELSPASCLEQDTPDSFCGKEGC